MSPFSNFKIKMHTCKCEVPLPETSVVYYPPNSPVADRLLAHLHETIDTILTNDQFAGIVIMGDFNQLDLTQLLVDPQFRQVVTQPTREDKTLDKIISNVANQYSVPQVCSPLGRSDHSTVLWSPLKTSCVNANTTVTHITRPLRDSNIRQFGSWICNHDWSPVMEAADPNQQATAFYNTLKAAIEHHFPVRTTKLHVNDKPWMTPSIKSLIRQRQDAFHNKNTRTWKYLRNKIVRAISTAKREHYCIKVKRLKVSNPAAWYREIKIITNSNKESKPIKVPGIETNNLFDIANSINNQFASVASDLPPINVEELPAYRPLPASVPIIHPWEVYHQLKNIKRGKSGGPDNIPTRIIKEYACELSTPLAYIFNTSLQSGIVPDVWKRAVIIPIPKTSPASVDKLRPIALTDHFAKVLEGFVARWTTLDLEPHLDPRQFGNRKGLSTTHCLIDLMNTLYQHRHSSQLTSARLLT